MKCCIKKAVTFKVDYVMMYDAIIDIEYKKYTILVVEDLENCDCTRLEKSILVFSPILF